MTQTRSRRKTIAAVTSKEVIIATPVASFTPQQGNRVKLSRIRVQLNDAMSHAEAEDITHRGIQFGLTVSPNRQHLYAEGAMASRQIFTIVRKVLAENYVNLFPRAVRTFSEYSGHRSQQVISRQGDPV